MKKIREREEERYLIEEHKKNVPGSVYRRLRAEKKLNPLLILYLLNCESDEESFSGQDIVAYGISFPGEPGISHPEEMVEYVVNTVWWQQEFLYLLDDDEVIDE